MEESESAAAERRAERKKARRRALRWLRSGVTPEDAVGRLERDGLSAKAAARVVQRADDRLQAELQGEVGDVCVSCGETLNRGDAFCDSCGTKVLTATDRHYHQTQIEPHLEKGRKWLGAMAILYALGGLLFGVVQQSMLIFAINLVLAGVQTGLWLWSKKNLLPAAVTSLVLFVSIHLLDAITDPASIFRGIIMKVLFIAALVQAIRAGLSARTLLRPSAPA